MKMSLGLRAESSLTRPDALECFAAVQLRVEQTEANVLFPVGARGVIVDTYEDGTVGVEFTAPAEDVLIVKREHLEPA